MRSTTSVSKSTRIAAVLFGLITALALVLVVSSQSSDGDGPEELDLVSFLDLVEDDQVATAVLSNGSPVLTGDLVDGSSYELVFPSQFGETLVTELASADPPIEIDTESGGRSLWLELALSFVPIVVILGVFMVFLFRMQNGRNNTFGRAKPRRNGKDQPVVTFADVAGADEAVDELREIRDFLQRPDRFKAIGAKIPKGVLLCGPPGTGKTLLARAVAGEAGVPFFSISGSDFVEMFVGVGASRVRDLFEQAKAEAPAIIFVDEIDAVGRHRGAGVGGGHDEREQTLNQLLVEMDGFDVSTGVILIAATNRPDILDPALLRPGRFDRHIVVDKPDLNGRKAIVDVHVATKPIGTDIDAEVIARRTPGFSGADLANLMNEAALLAARRSRPTIGMAEIEEAVDRVMAGPERRNRLMSDREKWIIAYHEAGHTLVGHALPGCDPIHKVSILARGRALGWTLALPTQDRYLHARSELRDQISMLLGGRAAEELIFGDPTTGAADDIERATNLARAMVTQHGMSDAIGPQQLAKPDGEVFLGRDGSATANHGEAMAELVDAEVRKILDTAYAEARELLTMYRPTLDRLAESLVAKETLEQPELLQIMAPLNQPIVHEAAA